MGLEYLNIQEAIENVGVKAYNPQGQVHRLRSTVGGALLTSGELYDTGLVAIPGIGVAAAYADADAFGTIFTIVVPPVGSIAQVLMYDMDDEGVATDIVICDAPFTATADNSAFAVSDTDLLKVVGVISISTFTDLGGMRVGQAYPAHHYTTQTGQLFCQCITRGTPTIAAANLPYLRFLVQ